MIVNPGFYALHGALTTIQLNYPGIVIFSTFLNAIPDVLTKVFPTFQSPSENVFISTQGSPFGPIDPFGSWGRPSYEWLCPTTTSKGGRGFSLGEVLHLCVIGNRLQRKVSHKLCRKQCRL